MYARIAHVSTRAVYIFHARWVILTMSGLHSSFTRKWPIIRMPSPMLKSNQNNCKQNSPRVVVSWTVPVVSTSREMCLLVVGEYKLYHSVWEPPIMYVAWKIPRSLGCYVENESITAQNIIYLCLKNSRSGTSANLCFPLRRAYLFTFMLSHHPLIKCTS